MQAIQPKMKELQKKYAKDQQKLNQEVMKLYKEEGVNPLGCAFPMLVQFPIWIALYQSVLQALAYTPENLVGLSKQLYSWGVIQGMVPLNHHFLWLDLTSGDFYMAIIVAASMWVLQKMSTPPSLDPQQQSMNRMMLWMMPLLFGFFALSLPSGLSLYWVTSNIISIVIQYRVTGWGELRMPSFPFFKTQKDPLRAYQTGQRPTRLPVMRRKL
jgi:YidC/Oxa1 family membrane protein insertase